MRVVVDRERAGVLGVTESQVTDSVVEATSSSRFVVPDFWADPKTGIGYQVQVEVAQQAMNSLDALANLPIAAHNSQQILLRSVGTVTRGTAVGEYDRYNMQRMVTVSANIYGEDLGHAAKQVREALREAGTPPPKVNVAVRGQVPPLEDMLGGLQNGLLLAVVVVFLLLVANFQSLRLSLRVAHHRLLPYGAPIGSPERGRPLA
ncbi:MAG: efflux RND transporter permease subunit [Candidatus Xenobia bacterium]